MNLKTGEPGAQPQGLIIKATGGFYYVDCGGVVYSCRARGLFRKTGLTPYVGDQVLVEPIDAETGYVTAVLPRKNSLIRPPLANIDQLAIVASSVRPLPNTLVIDTMTAIAARRGIGALLIFTKSDLAQVEELEESYRKAGYPVVAVSSTKGEGVEEVRRLLASRITAFTGNSGVGKSTLLNAIDPRLSIDTAEISDKLGRGRHTTRHVELFPLPGGGYVADTPGFSALEIEQFEKMTADQLQYCFPEFEQYIDSCRFTGCSHTKEKGCAVLEALQNGQIAPSRHQSYLALYEKLKDIRQWQLDKETH